MLQHDPRKRITAQAACEHPFLAAEHAQALEIAKAEKEKLQKLKSVGS